MYVYVKKIVLEEQSHLKNLIQLYESSIDVFVDVHQETYKDIHTEGHMTAYH